MPARKLYFEGIRVGDELPALAKAPIDRVQLSRYAGASGDFNPVHVDEVYAKSVGMPSVYAPGMLVMGMLSQLISDWARGGQLRRYHVRFIKMVWPGDTVVCKGRVSDRHGEGGRYFVDVELWAENQRGELVMKGNSTIQLFYSLEDENRQRAGQSPIVVEVPRESLLQASAAQAGEGSEEDEERRAAGISGKKTTGSKPAAKTAIAPSAAKKVKK
ncbi:MaoC family dehydratase [Vitiosangium sp. GDMCC 1.1324]|uniref:MaoC family dehydratase n=1 Tax=Vitiosangium sp. (strain GDMCC 1.1324) TaxID=2138576 RepID=UPI000D3D27F3|nr:MaoC family dehydratase [Vitiosangium sp. GDMCC 1.1324]PTL76117.1 acyl dehydratase [Vitiosangium sp. GDMCC 1.1324]